MSNQTPDFSHKYLSILRCSSWCIWPDLVRVMSKAIPIPLDGSGNQFAYASVHLVSYEKRPYRKIYSLKPVQKIATPPIWRGRIKSRYHLGNQIVHAIDDITAVNMHFELANKGEVDIQLHIGLEEDVSLDAIREVAFSISLSVISYINIELKDLLIPIAPIHVAEITDSGLHSSNTVSILAWERLSYQESQLQIAIDKFAQIFSHTDDSTTNKLRVALELYSAHYHEKSSIVRFLTLVMVLEVLKENKHKPKNVLDMIDTWREQVQTAKSRLDKESDEYAGLEAIERELIFRKEDSIRSQVRSLVKDTLTAEGNPRANELARQAVEIYDKRSFLVHKGTLSAEELADIEKQAKEIVEEVIKSKLRAFGN